MPPNMASCPARAASSAARRRPRRPPGPLRPTSSTYPASGDTELGGDAFFVAGTLQFVNAWAVVDGKVAGLAAAREGPALRRVAGTPGRRPQRGRGRRRRCIRGARPGPGANGGGVGRRPRSATWAFIVVGAFPQFRRSSSGGSPGLPPGSCRQVSRSLVDASGVGLHAGQDVLVGRDRERDVRVAEPLAHDLDRHSRLDEQRAVRMAELVQADGGDPGVAGDPLERRGDRVWVDGLASPR